MTTGNRDYYRLRVYVDKKRQVISFGNADDREADDAKRHIEHLVECQQRSRLPDRLTKRWLETITDTLHNRLASLGVITPRTISSAPSLLLAYLRAYISSRTDWKKPENYKQAVDKLETYLLTRTKAKRDVPLATLRQSDIEAWQRWMVGTLGMSSNTAGQNVKRCRQIMAVAVSDRLIETNPFANVKIDLSSDKSKNRFIDSPTCQLVLDACPDQEWRVIFSLCRWGGLRCPTEVLSLRWSDIDYAKQRFKVTSPKTARYGKSERLVPLFPELAKELKDLADILAPGLSSPLSGHVITRYRSSEANLRTQLHRICGVAKVPVWPKPFMALRATRRTELERSSIYPNYLLNAWFGHSAKIAEDHYLQVTDADYVLAAKATTALAGASSPKTKVSEPPESLEGPLEDPFREIVAPSASIRQCTIPNKKRALMALGTLLMAMGVHPSGFEPETLGSEDRCAIQLRHGCIYFLHFYRKPMRPSIAVAATFKASFPKSLANRMPPPFAEPPAPLGPPNR